MKKTLATLWLAWMLALSPKAQAEITPKTEETKKDLIEAVTTEHTTPEDDGKTISFEEVEALHENQQLVEEIMSNEKMQEIINKYWEEQVRQALEEIVSSEETEEVIEYLLSDQKVQRALEKWDWEALSQRMLHILRAYYGVRMLGIVSITVLSVLFLIYQIRDIKWWHYVIAKKK